jgi:hypothetical protein
MNSVLYVKPKSTVFYARILFKKQVGYTLYVPLLCNVLPIYQSVTFFPFIAICLSEKKLIKFYKCMLSVGSATRISYLRKYFDVHPKANKDLIPRRPRI